MTWVYYADRKPTEADADDRGMVLGVFKNREMMEVNINALSGLLAWLDIKLLPPLPPRKIWRAPTQADIDAMMEHIPCRVRANTAASWIEAKLQGVIKFGFVADDVLWPFCEIEVDA